jgi:hypothetical protein
MLLRSLRAAGLEPWACRVKWLTSSMSNLGGNRTRLGVDCDQNALTFAVKVVCGDNANLFVREVTALQAM